MNKIFYPASNSFVQQYEEVGKLFRKYLQQPIVISKQKELIVTKVLANVRENEELKLFYDCFVSWARGAGITEEKAMYLLADNTSGCQTMLLRYGSGIALLHTEEDYYDIEKRMGSHHTIGFRDGERQLYTLTYNDLMPGAGLYGWQKDTIVAVDSLFLREDGIEKIAKPMLANIIAWVVWQSSASELEPKKLVEKLKKLGTVIDGYAINVAYSVNNQQVGYKLTYSRDDWEIEMLGSKSGDNLRQVNIVEPRYSREKKPVAQWRHAPWKMLIDYHGYLERLRTMKVHVAKYHKWLSNPLQPMQIEEIHRLVQNKIYCEFRGSYVSEWMGACCIGLLDQAGLSVSMRRPKTPSSELEYLIRFE